MLSATNSMFQHPPHTLDHTNYANFGRPHQYAQDTYQNMSLLGSAVGGAGSESSSNYSPGTASVAENTDQELYVTTGIPSKFLDASLPGNMDIFGEYRVSYQNLSLQVDFDLLQHFMLPPLCYGTLQISQSPI